MCRLCISLINNMDVFQMRLTILFHRCVYKLSKPIFRCLRRHELVFVNTMPRIKGNAIFAVNHSCKYDIPYVLESLSQSAYVIVGKQPLKLLDRFSFMLNGVVWVDRKNSVDKKASVAKMKKLLCNGANLVIFPEGTWNLTPSKPMLPLYWGIVDIARYSCKPIVPIVLEYTDSKCYVAFGERMQVVGDDDKGKKIKEINDQLSTLKWTIWEQFPDTGYNTLEEWNTELHNRLSEYPKLNYKYENSVIRKEYDMVEEVFEHLMKLTPNSNNAFLFSKRNHF